MADTAALRESDLSSCAVGVAVPADAA